MKPEPFPLSWGQAGFVLLLLAIGLVGGMAANFFGVPRQGGFDARRERAAAVLGAFAGASAGLFAHWKTGLAMVGVAVAMAASLIGDVLRKALAETVEGWARKRAGALDPLPPSETDENKP